MHVFVDCVRVFHEKMGVSPQQRLAPTVCQAVVDAGNALCKVAATLEPQDRAASDADQRPLRAHLLIEELGETLQAMGTGDEVTALDGLADLLYVLFGTAVTFDLPIQAAFAEVHVSNMTKTRREDDPGRVRDKGSTYRPPDIAGVLAQHRAKKFGTLQPTELKDLHSRLSALTKRLADEGVEKGGVTA